MGYYDNVKDSIREENDGEEKKETTEESSSSDNSISGNFDTLREAAEETEVDDEEGDNTPIEVLEEDGLKQRSSKKSQQTKTKQVQGKKERSRTQKNDTSSNKASPSNEKNEISGDTSELEDKLDKIIEQNAQMIEILESFGN